MITKLRLAWLWIGILAVAPAWAAETTSLRKAIANLNASFGQQYHGESFLQRVTEFEQTAAAASTGEKQEIEQSFSQLQRTALLANPLLVRQPILFVVRQQYRKDHHNTATFFPCAEHEYNDGAFTPGGALKAIDLARGGEVRTLLETSEGVIRDPEVHFSGKKVVFSMRRSVRDSYHIYEINADGSGLKQLTFAKDVDDFDPIYLPDESIVFSSTREPKYCACNRHIMANLYRMEADGANIHQIGKSTLFEGHASLMPDGRILYDRWEYVDRNFGDAQGLWTVNPDGSNHALYWGNNTASPGAVLDGRIIPGTELAIGTLGSCHDQPWGALGIIDRSVGLEGPEPIRQTWPADAIKLARQSGWQLFDAYTGLKIKYEDPFPLNDKFFLCSRMTKPGGTMGVYVIDLFGNDALLHAEGAGCFDPMPLGEHIRPPALPLRRDYQSHQGLFYVEDVYQGTHMKGVKRGAVKYLRVVESPEKRFWTRPAWNGQGQEAPAMNWHDFNNKRILGTVPVEPDGSAYFAVPAEKFVYFQLLDENGMMIQSMRSGTMVQPGERAGCVGCHAEPSLAPPKMEQRLSSVSRTPRQLADWYGPPREFNYLKEVQPVFDRHCVSCHDYNQKAVHIINLARDRDLVFNTSYNELWRKKFIQVVGAGPADIQPAYSWGSHASKIVKAIITRRDKGQMTQEEMDRVVTWIDLNAPYYPSYASAYPNNLAGRSPLDDQQLARLEQLTGVRFRAQADHDGNRGPQISFDRPELSPCLTKFSDRNDPGYQEALGIIRAGQEALAKRPEADQDGFQPCLLDQWREEKYQARRQAELRNRQAIQRGHKVYDPGKD